jgi:hypothetical protein
LHLLSGTLQSSSALFSRFFQSPINRFTRLLNGAFALLRAAAEEATFIDARCWCIAVYELTVITGQRK